MEISHHIFFSEKEFDELQGYLQINNIAHEKAYGLYAFDMLESNPHWDFICSYLQSKNHRYQSETLFSTDELRQAQWLTMRTKWLNNYPQPVDSWYSNTYDLDHYCSKCKTGDVQSGLFRMKNQPIWKSRAFMGMNWVWDELFVSQNTWNILQSEKLTGISLLPVENKQGTATLSDVFQLKISHILPYGVCPNSPAIRNTKTCPACGVTKYVGSGKGMYVFHKEIFEGAPDFVKTAEMFGDGPNAIRKILINQRVYQAIVRHKLDRSIEFQPVTLI